MIAKYTEAVQQSVDLLEEKADSEAKEKQEFAYAQKRMLRKQSTNFKLCGLCEVGARHGLPTAHLG